MGNLYWIAYLLLPEHIRSGMIRKSHAMSIATPCESQSPIAQCETKHLYSMWGLASYYASRAYGSPIALAYAINIWSEASQYFVYPADAALGSIDKKNGKFASTCSGRERNLLKVKERRR